ncbi:undecaprenyl-diphosphatase [Neisseria sp. MVDL18-041461]|uniref:undecaprenyl-diphosphatase n=2 Tax=Neisseria TaxID=482 RepID=UPI00265EAA25|nr:undecaprenyl-diphosphatase [Neisseria sp. MVDL18-041461]MDO1515353.1 undecaprenyl-diphosphatase [Neisseria sp. MVDL18-041461]MDO1562713.1 undecaprenyl-diphosphatase [Neisseria sp. MVDL20-010259]
MDVLHELNKYLFMMINADEDAYSHSIYFAIFSAEYLIVWFFFILFIYLVAKHKNNKRVWLSIVFSIVIGVAITYLIRKGWYHPRPFLLQLGTNFLPHDASSSFPSKHLTSVFATLAGLLALQPTRALGLLVSPIVLTIAWSRIYLGVHWPLDILGALLVGIIAAVSSKYMVYKSMSFAGSRH